MASSESLPTRDEARAMCERLMRKLPSAELGKLRLCDLPAKEMLSVLEELRRRSQENAA